MNLPQPDRRLVENEKLARKKNRNAAQALKKYFKRLKSIDHAALEFNCECFDKTCEERVVLSIEEYQNIHKRGDRFVIWKNHDLSAIEKVIARKNNYAIVEKFALEA